MRLLVSIGGAMALSSVLWARAGARDAAFGQQASAASLRTPQTVQRMQANPPPAIEPGWADLIGEYGPDGSKIYVLEKSGRLELLRAGGGSAPLHSISADAFQIAGNASCKRAKLTFLRDPRGVVTGLRLGGVLLPRRRTIAPGQVFQITPLRPMDQLRREALASRPPVEAGKFLQPDLVDLTRLDPTIKLDVRYAGSRNFLGAPVYPEARAFLERPAAEALAAVSSRLHALGYGLLVYDAYRPWYVTKMFWNGTPKEKKIFVANPREGSRHNRGCAVDLTLYDTKTGRPVPMTGGYDEMSERSYPTYPGGTSLERWHRDLLRHAMEEEGFTVHRYEWWHFDYRGWRRYPILNLTFEDLDRSNRR